MGRGFTGALMRAYGAGEWVLTVVAVEDVTEHYRRIVVHAPGMFDGTPYGPASYIRLWAPDPDDPSKEFQRGYTIAACDEAAEQMTLEFVLHDPSGPASDWAARAVVGDRIAATRWGAPRFTAPSPPPVGYLLVGDMAALPGINGVLDALDDEVPILLHLEYTHDEDRTVPITHREGLEVTWVRRTGDPENLLRSIPPRDWSNWFAWVTAEAGATKALRARLKEWGFPKSHVKAQAYWSQGKEMGTSRDDAPVREVEDSREAAEVEEVAPGAGNWQATAGSRLLAPLKRPLQIAGLVQALVSLATLVPFVLLAHLCSELLDDSSDPGRLWPVAWWALGVLAAAAVLSTALMLVLHLLDARFGHAVRNALVDRIARVPLGWFGDRNSGTVRTAVQDDVAALHHLTTHAVTDAVAAAVTPLAVPIYLFVVHAGLAAILLIPVIAVYLLSMRMYNASSYGIEIFESYRGRVSAESGAHLAGLRSARIHDRGPEGRLGTLLSDRAAFLNRWQRPLTGLKVANDLTTRPTTMLALMLVAGTPMLVADWISPGDLVAFLLVGTMFGNRLMNIAYGITPMREGFAAAQRIATTLAEPVLDEPEVPSSLAPAAGHTVRFEGVGFRYDERRAVLEGIDLTLEPGTVTALVGPSGAGKSTLATLLARFHEVTEGRITIDGVDLRDLTTPDLLTTVGFVFQGQGLVRGSLHDNIALARPSASRADVEKAAQVAQVHDRVVALERGYDAVVGEDARLSGGEAQRVAIARAVLADPAILVLDEATAHADPESEHLVQAALAELVRGRTVLVIAHRLHTTAGADRIVVLDQGRIVEQGTHPDLLGSGGLYRELWDAADLLERDEVPAR